MRLDEIVPWGRTLDEYRAMFALSEQDLAGALLGCGDGPASANAELTRQGGRMISIDPLYQFTSEQIRARIDATAATVLAQSEQGREHYRWDRIPDPAALGRLRLGAMALFLEDYPAGQAAGRYRVAALPDLPFCDSAFDLALCSHLLFLYSELLSFPTHLAAVRAMLRVAPEARIFPLLDLSNQSSPHLAPLCATLTAEGYQVEIVPVEYEFQRGANQMLRLRRRPAPVTNGSVPAKR